MTSTRQRIGLALSIFLSVGNIASVLTPTPEGETGPPYVVLVVGALLGLVGAVGSVIGWRTGNRTVLRIVAGCIVVMALLAAPAFFVPVPAALKALVGLVVLLTVGALILILSGRREGATVEATS